MDRLTSRGIRISEMPLVCSANDRFWSSVYDKLAAYEDAEEQGRLVMLPCKVGDTVYYISAGKSYKAKASMFRVNKSGLRVYCERNYMGCVGFDGIYGKTVFLNREEAEAALKGEREDG